MSKVKRNVVGAVWMPTTTGDSVKGPWRVRGPIMGKPMYWLHLNGSRYTPTGLFNDAPSFVSRRAAEAFADCLLHAANDTRPKEQDPPMFTPKEILRLASVPLKRGDPVQTYFDTGAFGYSLLYGRVIKAGPKTFTVLWESGLTNRLRQGTFTRGPGRGDEGEDYAEARI
jgi:hypothetical protein